MGTTHPARNVGSARHGPPTGSCFSQDGAGIARLGWDPDGIPGGPLALDVFVPRCTSEPSEGEVIENLAWQIISSYTFEVPDPTFSPDGIGFTGLETFVDVEPPAAFTDSIVSPVTGRVVTVEISVAAVIVDWDDGTWSTIFVPNTTIDVSYRVDEIVSRNSG